MDSIATVIFTSGSTGDPKGVVLSHRNILSNVLQGRRAGPSCCPTRCVLGILPFFHSFGIHRHDLDGSGLGKRVVYHINPLDAKIIGKLCEKHKVTLIAGTPSFTRFYIKRALPSSSRRSTHLVLGAEKLKPELYRDIAQVAGHRADGGLWHHRALAGGGGEFAAKR